MQLKRGLNVAITRNALTQNPVTKGGKCDDTHQYCSNTNGCFYPRKPVASKQPTCVESEREVNKVNGRLMETMRVRARADITCPPRHTPPFHHLRYKPYTLRPPEALRTPLRACEGPREPGQSASSAMKASSASTRPISRRSATSIRLDTSSPSKSLMSFVTSVTMSRAS